VGIDATFKNKINDVLVVAAATGDGLGRAAIPAVKYPYRCHSLSIVPHGAAPSTTVQSQDGTRMASVFG
jgi:hypothetical protein